MYDKSNTPTYIIIVIQENVGIQMCCWLVCYIFAILNIDVSFIHDYCEHIQNIVNKRAMNTPTG